MIPDIGRLRPWADPTQLHIHRLPMRASRPADPARTLDLGGTWAFRLAEHPDDVEPTAVTGATPEPTDGWRPIQVPGNWTMQIEEDLPHYTNIQMPFPGPPPRLPERNPTGVHRRSFVLEPDWLERCTVLHVGGAESVHAVFVNDVFVGYGTDSRLPSEYDVSDAVTAGENHLAIVVIRYSAHSYVEDQDQWWMAGLHRQVRLESRPVQAIADIGIDADWDPARGTGSLRITTQATGTDEGRTTRAWLEHTDGAPVAEAIVAAVPHEHAAPYVFTGTRTTVDWTDLEIDPWSSESPTLYRVGVELLGPDGSVLDTAWQRVGFRRVEISDRQLKLNGRPVWIFGVNRHDHHPDRGKAVTIEDMRADLVAMRRLNINAVRAAHYPNDSAFLDLCDELGFLVVDEANIECHGYNRSLCHDATYAQTWLERGSRMVQRDRNHPCVIVWSLGNESGYGANHDALAGWIRRTDPSRPLHYEDAVRTKGWVDGGRAATDLVCPMYPSIDEIVAYGNGDGDRPLIMCEYSHAMGNSNGSLADYWEAITATPGLQGGFIWEWKDHGLRRIGADGRPTLAYGGQFGDTPHDCNFVADGVMSADLEPHPASRELAWVHRPVCVRANQSALEITNRYSFTGLDALEPTWRLLVDGSPVESGVLDVGAVAPGTTITVPQPVGEPGDDAGDVRLQVTWRHRAATWFAPAGAVAAWDEVVLREGEPPPVPVEQPPTARRELPLSGPRLNLFRGPTDNDGFKLMPDLAIRLRVGGHALRHWLEQGLDRLDPESLVEHTCTRVDDGSGVTFHHRILVPDDLTDLPRVGVRFEAPARFTDLRWFGRGPHENYPDRKSSAMTAIWEGELDRLPYLVPQEFGLRSDCRWFELHDPATGECIRIEALGVPVHVSATRHSPEQLHRADHADSIVEHDRVVVAIDAAHRGLGTASCGPDVLPRYRLTPGRHSLAYRISTDDGS